MIRNLKHAALVGAVMMSGLYLTSCSDDVKYVLPEGGTGISRWKDTIELEAVAGAYALPFDTDAETEFSIVNPNDMMWIDVQKNSGKPLKVKANEYLGARCADICASDKEGKFSMSFVVRQQGTACQEVVNVPAPGKLPELLDARKEEITSLKVTGKLNGDDILFLRQMAAGPKTEYKRDFKGKLAILDLRDAEIVAGGSPYYSYTYTEDEGEDGSSDGEFLVYFTADDIVGDNMFSNCRALKNIALPDKAYKIGEYAFSYCYNLEQVILPPVLKDLGEGAFYENYLLQEVELPASLEKIAIYAFYYCYALDHVKFHDGLKTLPAYCFKECGHLRQVELPSTLEVVEEYAFNKSGLEKLCLPEGVKKLEETSFYECYNLKEVTLPSTLEYIGDYAFGYCKSLNSIRIPASVKQMGDYVFYYSTLLHLIMEGGNIKFTDYTFDYLEYLKDLCFSPEQTVVNGNFDAYDMDMLVPASVTEFKDFSFYGKSIRIYSTSVPAIAGNDFNIASPRVKIYVPDSMVDSYKTDKIWGKYADQIFPMPENNR